MKVLEAWIKRRPVEFAVVADFLLHINDVGVM